MGTAGRAQARSPPGTAALKSEPSVARLVGRAGGGAGANAGRGRRWGGACRLPAPVQGLTAAFRPGVFGLGLPGLSADPRRAGVPWEPPQDGHTAHCTRCPEGRLPGGASSQAPRSSDPPPQVLWLLVQVARMPACWGAWRLGVVTWSSGNLSWGGGDHVGPVGHKWAASCTLTLETPAVKPTQSRCSGKSSFAPTPRVLRAT